MKSNHITSATRFWLIRATPKKPEFPTVVIRLVFLFNSLKLWSLYAEDIFSCPGCISTVTQSYLWVEPFCDVIRWTTRNIYQSHESIGRVLAHGLGLELGLGLGLGRNQILSALFCSHLFSITAYAICVKHQISQMSVKFCCTIWLLAQTPLNTH